ncbi:sugar ABC transporter permease [Lederbergia sp. NSJ-179]|uniref:carbohydrate ABC transporter permease n=1 Tax=Lederbergia sp. NSJ-179 TaxID=2931402 RepID=UPI001FCF9644|nr:sugar ABC transporter permease [Lederbergia sp. NSJ-179]MCJ7842114.1 sugar ABC transporter permease [Lederbergia sp. NSJ-179]
MSKSSLKVLSAKPKYSQREKRRFMWAYIFLLPQAIVFLTLSVYPIIMSYVYSFFNWTGFGPLTNFVGLDNYIRLLTQGRFWNAFLNTFYYVIGTTVFSVGFSLVLAIILNDARLRGKAFYRTIYFLPVVTTTAIIGIIMGNIFGIDGLVNQVFQTIISDKKAIPWLSTGTLAMLVLILVGSWKSIGINMIYWLAGLQAIPTELYESAQLDGAGFWKTLKHVTLPLIKPMLAVIVLLSLVSGMHVFDLVKTLTDGGPYRATETLDLYIYNYAFADGEGGGTPMMGYASAAGVLLGIFTFLISIIFGGAGFSAEIRKFRKTRAEKKAAK